MAECGSCNPTHLAPLSPVLHEGELRMVLNWAEKPKDFDIYVMRRNSMNWNQKCMTYYAKKSGCREATLDLDNTKGGNNSVETHWIAGCLRITGSSYQLRPVNMFLNGRPDKEVPDLCLDSFGLTTTTTTTPRPRTTTTRRPWYRRLFG